MGMFLGGVVPLLLVLLVRLLGWSD
jgi:hypothetical protein